jgi:hypothetical protein
MVDASTYGKAWVLKDESGRILQKKGDRDNRRMGRLGFSPGTNTLKAILLNRNAQ